MAEKTLSLCLTLLNVIALCSRALIWMKQKLFIFCLSFNLWINEIFMQMALGKLAQPSCCWNCAVHTSLVYELTYPHALAIRAHVCRLPHLKPCTAFGIFTPKARGTWAAGTCWACATWRICLKFENYGQMESSPLMAFLRSQTELRITKGTTKFVETGCPHSLSSQHNLTEVPQWKVLHLSVLACTKIPATNPFSSSCQFIFVNHLVAAALLLSGSTLP